MRYLLLTLLIFSLEAEANLSQLAQDYLDNGVDVLEANSGKRKSLLDVQAFQVTRTWNLTASGTKLDANSESSTTYTVTPYDSTSYSLGVAKAFEWGGTLSLTNSLTNVKTSALERSGFSQGLSYSQDLGKNFFGSTFFKDVAVLEKASRATEYAQDQRIQAGLIGLANSYTSAQLNKSLFGLQGEAVERAQKRLELIKGRVRDGLREQVDLIQARIALLSAEEQKKSFAIGLSSSMEKMASYVHRSVKESEIIPFQLLEDKRGLPEGDISNNLTIHELKVRLDLVAIQREKTDLSYIPAINLTAAVTNNDFDVARSEAISKGKLGEDQKDVSATLSLSWAIGNAPQKIEDQKVAIDEKLSQAKSEKLTVSLNESSKEFVKQIKLLNETVESSRKRLSLAKSALDEYTKLYKRGKADLDQVIRAEEDLILTERSLVQNISQRQSLHFTLSSLYGNLKSYLLKEK